MIQSDSAKGVPSGVQQGAGELASLLGGKKGTGSQSAS